MRVLYVIKGEVFAEDEDGEAKGAALSFLHTPFHVRIDSVSVYEVPERYGVSEEEKPLRDIVIRHIDSVSNDHKPLDGRSLRRRK